jgi:hypothetical protein
VHVPGAAGSARLEPLAERWLASESALQPCELRQEPRHFCLGKHSASSLILSPSLCGLPPCLLLPPSCLCGLLGRREQQAPPLARAKAQPLLEPRACYPEPALERPRPDPIGVGHLDPDEATAPHPALDLPPHSSRAPCRHVRVEQNQLPYPHVAVVHRHIHVVLLDVARDDLERERRGNACLEYLPRRQHSSLAHPRQHVHVRRASLGGIALDPVHELVSPRVLLDPARGQPTRNDHRRPAAAAACTIMVTRERDLGVGLTGARRPTEAEGEGEATVPPRKHHASPSAPPASGTDPRARTRSRLWR